ncbi:dihydrolipoamide dehydrogenase [Sphingomonas sp. Leaf17]|uniref:dihydrolipoyl dehydrogenase n=1 Tax=Sphingomonas sp. Leaf17 TaxID=1735683 RepID=UPI000700DDF6|nr:dihydrolipoyl dehydrogenase [Sphingomonas sp. Leaf17]KQM68024.1 dihydrolipoamide dehydrogenase [Sphingomonas sp. Leaf17]
MQTLECDVAVIGAGTAGLAAERAARRAGATTLLIDDRFAGTTCASVGCMPSKLLIAAGKAAHAVRNAGIFGVTVPTPTIDGAAVMARVRHERDRFVAGTKASIARLPDGIAVQATARFVDATTLALDDGRHVRAESFVIATGSRPMMPPMFAALGDRALTNETIFELSTLPASMAVIGAGAIGLELAQALARLGVAVTVFDTGARIGGVKDAVVEPVLRDLLARELDFVLGVTVEARRDGDGVAVSWTGDSSGKAWYDHVLVAVGRPPALDRLNLDATGLVRDDHGTPVFDPATMQCGASAIFIAGDADASRTVLHEASDEGAIAGRNAARFPDVEPAERAVPFTITFTDPPIATIGQPAGDDSVIGEASYADQGRAKVEARNVGLARIYADPKDGRLTGAVMAAPGMDHVGHLIAWAIARGETATALLDLPLYHPTLEEGLKPALRAICHAVHAPTGSDADRGIPPGA